MGSNPTATQYRSGPSTPGRASRYTSPTRCSVRPYACMAPHSRTCAAQAAYQPATNRLPLSPPRPRRSMTFRHPRDAERPAGGRPDGTQVVAAALETELADRPAPAGRATPVASPVASLLTPPTSTRATAQAYARPKTGGAHGAASPDHP